MSQFFRSAQVGAYSGCSIVYDLRSGAIDHEITDYSLSLIRERKLSPLTVGQAIGHILAFRQFMLRQPSADLDLVHQETMLAFQADQLDSVKKSPAYRGDERLAKHTVNQKLAAVYHWMLWLRDQGRLGRLVIGERDCQVQVRERQVERFDGRRTRIARVVEVPIAYRGTGRGSKHSTAYAATAADIEALEARIAETASSNYLFERNGLLAVIPQLTGLRRGSMNSLLVSQFDPIALQEETATTVRVTPRDQKFGYDNSFEFPTLLALRISDFIEGARAELLKELGIDERVAQNRVFLSEKDGRPLTGGSITRIMSREMRAIGAPKGAAVHAGRHLFANDMIEKEIKDRTAQGQDTSTASICNAVALKMGQRDPNSLFAYVSAQQSRYASRQLQDSRHQAAVLKEGQDAGEHWLVAGGGDRVAPGVIDEARPARLLVVDINALCFSALRNPKFRDCRHFGRRTGAIVGALDYLGSRCSVDRDRTLVVVWDDRCTWREAIHADYKASRWASASQRVLRDEYAWQAEVLRGLLAHLGVLQLRAAGFEADDLAGYICQNASADWNIRLITNDSDWFQALRPGVDLILLPSNRRITDMDLRDTGSVNGGPFRSAQHYLAAKCLAGDASDGIPGVPGVGLKSAARLIGEFDSVESIWASFDAGSLPKRDILRRVADPESRKLYRRNRQLIDWTLAPSPKAKCHIDLGEASVDKLKALAIGNGLVLRMRKDFARWAKCDMRVAHAIRSIL